MVVRDIFICRIMVFVVAWTVASWAASETFDSRSEGPQKVGVRMRRLRRLSADIGISVSGFDSEIPGALYLDMSLQSFVSLSLRNCSWVIWSLSCRSLVLTSEEKALTVLWAHTYRIRESRLWRGTVFHHACTVEQRLEAPFSWKKNERWSFHRREGPRPPMSAASLHVMLKFSDRDSDNATERRPILGLSLQ